MGYGPTQSNTQPHPSPASITPLYCPKSSVLHRFSPCNCNTFIPPRTSAPLTNHYHTNHYHLILLTISTITCLAETSCGATVEDHLHPLARHCANPLATSCAPSTIVPPCNMHPSIRWMPPAHHPHSPYLSPKLGNTVTMSLSLFSERCATRKAAATAQPASGRQKI